MISLLPAPPAPPAQPTSPGPPPLAPCFDFKVKTTLTSWGSEQSWALTGPSSLEEGWSSPDFTDDSYTDQGGDETVMSSVSPMDACTDSVSTGCAPTIQAGMTDYDMISLLPAPPAPP